MGIQRIEHIGIAVNNLEDATAFFERILDIPCSSVEELTEHGVIVAIFKIGSVKVELLASKNPNGAIDRFIKKKGQGVHHIAFMVDDTDESLEEFSRKGIELIDEESKIGAEGLSIGFLDPKDTLGILMELCSSKQS